MSAMKWTIKIFAILHFDRTKNYVLEFTRAIRRLAISLLNRFYYVSLPIFYSQCSSSKSLSISNKSEEPFTWSKCFVKYYINVKRMARDCQSSNFVQTLHIKWTHFTLSFWTFHNLMSFHYNKNDNYWKCHYVAKLYQSEKKVSVCTILMLIDSLGCT